MPAAEIVFFGILMGFLALPWIKEKDDCWLDIVRPRLPWLWSIRAVAYLIESLTAVVAFTRLPLSVVYSVLFLAPIFATLVASIFLHERVSWKCWTGIILGFGGILVVFQPGLHPIDVIGAMAAVICASAGVVDMVVLRVARDGEKNISQLGATMVIPLIITGLMTAFDFRWPTSGEFFLIGGYGVGAVIAGMLLIRAFRNADVGRVAPTQYVQMVWAILLGYFLFNDAVNFFMAIGIITIVTAGWLVYSDGGKPVEPEVSST